MAQTRRRRKKAPTRMSKAEVRRHGAARARGTRKRCARCMRSKKLSDFGENHRMRLGRKSYCKKCSAELQKEWSRKKARARKNAA